MLIIVKSSKSCKQVIWFSSKPKTNHMQTFKRITTALFLTGILTTSAFAFQETKKISEKQHKCTAACTKAKHAYAHGEKGHVCGDACKKTAEKKGNM